MTVVEFALNEFMIIHNALITKYERSKLEGWHFKMKAYTMNEFCEVKMNAVSFYDYLVVLVDLFYYD